MKGKVFTFMSLLTVLVLLLGGPGAVPGGANQALAVPSSEAQPTRMETSFPSSPVMFIQNVGQFDERALFQVQGGDKTIWLAEDSIWITVLESLPSTRPPDGGYPSPLSQRERGEGSGVRGEVRAVALKLSFPGANPHPRIEPFGRLETSVNYFIGNDPEKWSANVPVWAGVRYVDFYPGIDLELTSEGGRVVQRIVARPGADLSAVRLRVEGVEAVELLPSGEGLRLTTAVGKFTLPLLTVEGWETGDSSVRQVNAQTFDVAFPFTPASSHPETSTQSQSDLLYATFLGGSSGDYGFGIAVDGGGNAYVTGYTFSSDFPNTPGAYDPIYNDNYDAFVAKLNSTGSSLVYATFLGGNDSDYGWGIAVDGGGNVYVTGSTSSSDFPATPGAYDTTYNGGTCGTAPYTYPCSDAFVAKLNPTGSALLYATFLGGNDSDYGWGIAVDGGGNAYVTGSTSSSDFPATPGAYDITYNGGTCGTASYTYPCSDAFVAKLNPTGSGLVYATFLGGSDDDDSWGIAVDGSGNAYVTGKTQSPNFPTTLEAYDRIYNGGMCGAAPDSYLCPDAFVAKLNLAGSALLYATFLGGSSYDWGNGIAVDGSGNAYVTGETQSTNFPATPGAYDTTYNGNQDAFVATLNPTGCCLVYATFLGGSNRDHGWGIAVDGSGNAYVIGDTSSLDFPATPEAYDTSYNGGTCEIGSYTYPCLDAFVAKLKPTRSNLIYATFLGGSSDDWGNGIAVDRGGNAYVTGMTESSDFPATLGAYGGYSDAFVTKLAVRGGVATGSIMLFGGATDRTVFADMWEYDGNDWIEVYRPGEVPGPRSDFSLVFDERRNRLVLFGGHDGTQPLGDTWEYSLSGGTWTKIVTPRSPSPRYDAEMIYDKRRGVIVLFGGTPGSYIFYNDTWEYDGTDWRPVATHNSPPGSLEGSMVYDEVRGRAVLVTGWQGQGFGWVNETWEYDGTNWTYVTQAPSWRYNFAMAYDSARQKVVLFGGFQHGGIRCGLDDTWEYDGQRWARVQPTRVPPGRCGHAMTYDPIRRVVVLFGGDAGGGNYQNDIWEYDGIEWKHVPTLHKPAGRVWAGMTSAVRRRAEPGLSHLSYIGPLYLPADGVMVDEVDGKITPGDHVHLRLPFRNTGSQPISNATVQISGAPQTGSRSGVSIYDGVSWLKDQVVFLTPSTVNPGQTAVADFWIFVANNDPVDRVSLAGDTWLRVTTANGQWTIRINLSPLVFTISGNDELKTGSCLHHPDNFEIQKYAQYAAGAMCMKIPPTNSGDPDTPEQAVRNLVHRVNQEFNYRDQWGTRQPDIVLLSTRHGYIGVCRDYADLTTGLLRALGLPSRFTDAIFIRPVLFVVGHAWVEVYLEDRGWRQADSTWDEAFNEGIYKNRGYWVWEAWADQYPLSSSSIFAASEYQCIQPCYSSPPDCPACLRESNRLRLPWPRDLSCVENVTARYRVSSQGISLAADGEIVIGIRAPALVTRTVPFTFEAGILNNTGQPLSPVTATVSISGYVDSAAPLFQVDPPFHTISTLGSGEKITVTWTVTPLVAGSLIPLRVAVEGGGNFDFAEHPLVVNEPNTPLPLTIDGLCTPGTVELGQPFTLTVHLLDENLNPLTDASTSVTATVYSTPTLGYSTTVALSAEPDGFFRKVLTLPQDAPLGTYWVDFAATRAGYDPARASSAFFVAPSLTMTLEVAPVVVSPADALTITAQVYRQGMAVGEASVWAQVKSPDGEVIVPLVFDGSRYTASFRPMDLAPNLGGTVRGGRWEIHAAADYYGGSARATTQITVLHRLYLPLILRNR